MKCDRRLTAQLQGRRGLLSASVGAGLAAGVATLYQAYLLSSIIDGVFRQSLELRAAGPHLVLFALAGMVRAGCAWGNQVAGSRLAGRIKTDLRLRLVRHLSALGPRYTVGERSGEIVNAAMEGVERLDAYFSRYLPQLFLAFLIPLAILLFVFPLDLLSGLVLLSTAPLIPLFMVLISGMARTKTERQWQTLRRMSAHFLDILQGLTTLKMLGRSREQGHEIARVSDRFRRRTMGVLKIAFLSALVLELVATLSVAIVAVEIGLRLLYDHIAFRQALFILILAPEFYAPLRQMGARFHAGMEGVAAAERIFAILETRPFTCGTHRSMPSMRAIVFDRVTYQYDSDRRPALEEVSLKLCAGETIALIGPSGAGKSTIAQLLLRFIDPAAGRILVDGDPLDSFDAEIWRKQVAWVPQRPYLFHQSIGENLRMARPSASLAEVVEAARQAHLHDFIASLPRGYDTPVGENGIRLSSGQAQRLALGRAFLKDAPLLILDEPTAHLDLETEEAIRDSVSRLTQERTTLLIAHRLRVVEGADHLVVMEAGQVREQGTAAQLLAARGTYYRMVQAYQEMR